MIRPPSINLARRPFRNNTVYYVVFATCFAVLLVASVYNVYDFTRTGEDLTRLETDLAERKQVYMALHDEVERMKKDISSLNLQTLDSKSTFANGLILSRLFSWSTLFDRMEDLIPPDVRIRSIRPSISPKGIEIQLDGLTKNAEQMYEFETNLTDSDYFLRVYPLSENTRESKTEINFDLTMDYIPAGKPGSEAAASPPTPVAGLPGPPEGAEEGSEDAATAASTAATDDTQEAQAGAGQTDADTTQPAAPPEQASAQPAAPTAQAPAPSQQQQPAAQPPAVVPTPAPAQPKPQTPARTIPTGPVLPPVGQGVVLGAEAAARPSKPLTQYTNKEFIDTYGETKFMRLRGSWLPKGDDLDPKVNNEAYIQQYGLEKFLADRGGLDRDGQIPGGRR